MSTFGVCFGCCFIGWLVLVFCSLFVLGGGGRGIFAQVSISVMQMLYEHHIYKEDKSECNFEPVDPEDLLLLP